MIRYSLVGKHQHRTPLSYVALRKYLPAALVHVELTDKPDILVFGYVQDFAESFSLIKEARQRNPLVKLVVLSEEPFWDTLWSGDYTQFRTSKAIGDTSVHYYALNHVNSSIFEYREIPYFVATDDAFFARYSLMFTRNNALNEQDYRQVWEQASVRCAFFAEKRLADKFTYNHPDNDIQGLCQFRSRLAQLHLEAKPTETRVVGRGWHTGVIRQKLPDWHLDKLAALDGRSRFISALENTHHPLYTTEKLFDAYACRGIPLYWASPGHSINEWIPDGSYVNLFGLSPEAAMEKLHAFVSDQDFIEQYRAAQAELARRFGSVDNLASERRRIADAVFKALSAVMEGEERSATPNTGALCS